VRVDKGRGSIFDQYNEWHRKKQEWIADLDHARKLAGIGTKSLSPASPQAPTSDIPSEINPRQAFVFPLLEQRGWSLLKWADEALVSHDTVIDYLANRTKPYRSTRLKLAKALGISVQQLPR
jgi:lambda repressor-like predicted transcriptional regulator